MSVKDLPKTPEGAVLDIYVGPSRKLVLDPKAVPVTLKVNISRKGWEDPAYRHVVLEDLADMIVTALENAE